MGPVCALALSCRRLSRMVGKLFRVLVLVVLVSAIGWVAVEELKLRDQNSKTRLFTVYQNYGDSNYVSSLAATQ